MGLSCVPGGNRNQQDNRIILPYATWTVFVDKRVDIERLVQSNSLSSLVIQDFVIELVKVHNVHNVKLSLYNKCLYMKPSTILFMLELERCVEYVYSDLCHCTSTGLAIFDGKMWQHCNF